MVRDLHHTHTDHQHDFLGILLYITCDRYPSLLQRQATSFFFSIVLSAFFVISASSLRSTGLNLDLIKKYSLSLSLYSASTASVEYVPPGTRTSERGRTLDRVALNRAGEGHNKTFEKHIF